VGDDAGRVRSESREQGLAPGESQHDVGAGEDRAEAPGRGLAREECRRLEPLPRQNLVDTARPRAEERGGRGRGREQAHAVAGRAQGVGRTAEEEQVPQRAGADEEDVQGAP
jgi:hypothetical protein